MRISDWSSDVCSSDLCAQLISTPTTEVIQFEMSWAHRPATSRLSWLNKSEFRSDKVRDAIAGQPGPIGGGALTIDGDATSRRLLNSLSVNWTPPGERGEARERDEVGTRVAGRGGPGGCECKNKHTI